MTRADRERLAAEYVVGLLEGEERKEAEHLLGSDPIFQRAVADWRHRLSELNHTALPEPQRTRCGTASSPSWRSPRQLSSYQDRGR